MTLSVPENCSQLHTSLPLFTLLRANSCFICNFLYIFVLPLAFVCVSEHRSFYSSYFINGWRVIYWCFLLCLWHLVEGNQVPASPGSLASVIGSVGLKDVDLREDGSELAARLISLLTGDCGYRTTCGAFFSCLIKTLEEHRHEIM